ncbi:MAG: hypothetical protein RLZZ200_620 [Pseudomonadota bacterium]|jgi:phosphoglycerate dehydrogenase-like enzyme
MKTLLVWTGGEDGLLCEALSQVPGLEIVRGRDKSDAIVRMSTVDGMIGSVIPWDASLAEALRKAPRLRWLQVLNIGFDNLEALGLPPQLQLSTLGELGSPAVVEHAVALLMALSRGLHRARDLTRGARWDGASQRVGMLSLHDCQVAILGVGPIGLGVAQALRSIGAKPVGLGTRARIEAGIPVRPVSELHAVLAGSAAVIVCAPLKRETLRLLDAAAFAAMPKGSFVVNISRGPIIDTDALVAAMESGQIAGAGLDVTDPEPLPPEHPLWRQDGALITPHVAWAGAAPSGQQQRIDYVVANARRFATGQAPAGLARFESIPS